MNTKKILIISLILNIILASCAAVFPYKHWDINLETQTLQGIEPKDDLPMSVCAHDAAGYHCSMMWISDINALESDYKTKTDRLEILEKICGNGNSTK